MKRFALVFYTLFIWTIQVQAQAPAITPLDLKTLKGETALQTINNKIQECQRMANYLADLLKKTTSNTDTLSQALDLFQGVVYQLINLKGEISGPPEALSITLPTLPPPPYSVTLYQKLLETYSTAVQRLESLKRQAQLSKEELGSLGSEIKDLTAQWLALKKKAPPPPEYYLVLAQLISSQAQYMSKSIKFSRMTQKITKLNELQTQANQLLEKVFAHLKLESKDLKGAQQRFEMSQKNLNKIHNQVRQELTRLNRQAALLEVKKRRIVQQFQQSGLSEQTKRTLQREKERLEILLEETQLLRKLASQKEERALLDFTEASFQLQWLKCYMGICSKKEKIEYLERWKEELRKLREELKSTKIDFNRLQTTSEIINNKVISLEQARSSGGKERANKALVEAYKRILRTLSALSQVYQENINKEKNLVLVIGYTLDLFKKRAGGLEKLYTWFTENKKAISNKVKTILYYPIWTTGQTPFTLATIIKFLLILILGMGAVRLLRRKASKILVEQFSLSPGTVNSLTTLIYYVLVLIVSMVALSAVGIDLKQVTIILGALGVGIGFGLQTIANNFVSGIILLTERSIEAGDIVELEDGTMGEVKRISIRSTVIRTYDGLDIIVPNSELVSGRVTTWTYEDDWRRLKIPFGVAYGSDPNRVAQLAKEAAREVENTIEDTSHPIEVWFQGFGASSLDFTLMVWVRMSRLKIKTGLTSDYYFKLHEKLTQAGIEIPFPQQDIHIRSLHPQVLEGLKILKNGEEKPTSQKR